MNVSEKISQLIENKGFTKKKVYDFLGLSRRGFDIKLEENRFDNSELEKLSTILDVPVSHFFEGPAKKNVEFLDETKLKKIKVPVLPISAFASFVENIEKGLNLNEIEIDFDVVEKIEGIRYDKFTVIARITGNSMYPHYKSGCKVLCTFVSNGNWEYTRGACVVSLRSGMVVFKRVKVGSKKNVLLLTSDNEEGGDMEVAISDILCLWKAEYKTYEPAE